MKAPRDKKTDSQRSMAYTRRRRVYDLRMGLWVSREVIAEIDGFRGELPRTQFIEWCINRTLNALKGIPEDET